MTHADSNIFVDYSEIVQMIYFTSKEILTLPSGSNITSQAYTSDEIED